MNKKVNIKEISIKAVFDNLKEFNLFQVIYNLSENAGHTIMLFLIGTGRFSIFVYHFFGSIFKKHFFLRNMLNSFYTNGFCSIPVVGLTGIFTGAVLTVQLFYSLSMFGVEDSIPYIVLIATMKELAPVLSGLMIVARVGSSMSAEIGSYATNNQIDTLTSMSINKYRFLYAPRVISMMLAGPMLVTITDIMSIFGSFVVARQSFGYTNQLFFHLIYDGFAIGDYMVGVVKSIVFCMILSIVACYNGDKTQNGAVGIKNSTISTVVKSCVYILMFNFIITFIMG